MQVEKLDIVRFAPKGEDSFYDAVVDKVAAYFEANNISPYANREMWVKTIAMLLLYFVPYILIVTRQSAGSYWLFFGLWFLMGMGMSGIGTSVMHDANHGTYSPDKKVNNFISRILEIIGGYRVTWRIQHNVLHHTYTNVAGLDEDIDGIILIAAFTASAQVLVSSLPVYLRLVLLYDDDAVLDDCERQYAGCTVQTP